MSDALKKIRLAAVQASSVHLDRDATVEKACGLIREAGKAGASLVGFPEGFIPAHPSWFTVQPGTGKISLGLSQRLFQNSVVIPGEQTDKLGAACRDAGVTAVIGVCEKRADTTGTMFNTQLFIGPDGNILGKHQKLMPTLAERIVHTGGWGDTLKAYETPFGRVSGLICGENANPLAASALMAMYPVVHVASWPAFVSPAVKLSDVISAISRGLAYSMGCFVINATGVVSEAALDDFQLAPDARAPLEKLRNTGYASIIGPSGQVLSQPLDGEGVVYADVDLNDVMVSKILNDFAGHYNRPDVFSLHINEAVPEMIRRHHDAKVEIQANSGKAENREVR
ncbi:MAG: carbon-nitrogen hydrolase family protein [Pseudomonadota bacterium]